MEMQKSGPKMETQIRYARLKREQKERFIKAEQLNKAASNISLGNGGNYLNNGSIAKALEALNEVRTQMLPIGLKLEVSPQQVQKELSEMSQNTTISLHQHQGGAITCHKGEHPPTMNMEQQSQLIPLMRQPVGPGELGMGCNKGPFGGMQGSIDRCRPQDTKIQGGARDHQAFHNELGMSNKRGRKGSSREKQSSSSKSSNTKTQVSSTGGSSGFSKQVSSGGGTGGGSAASSASPRLKASNFPASTLQIGTWKKVAAHEGELMAKCYYAKKKLVWEVMQNGVKSKIEMLWNDIVYLNYSIPKNRSSFLEIELRNPPVFAEELDPQPRKHTLWHKCEDFTSEQQASRCKPHRLFFAPGVLNKHID